MKSALVLLTLLATMSSTFAFRSTAVDWVRGDTEAEVETKIVERVREIHNTRWLRLPTRTKICERPKVYEVSAPKKSYRVGRGGELIEKWSAVIKMTCMNEDD